MLRGRYVAKLSMKAIPTAELSVLVQKPFRLYNGWISGAKQHMLSVCLERNCGEAIQTY